MEFDTVPDIGEHRLMWRLLAGNSQFRMFLFADLISCFGNGLSGIGVTWFIRESMGSNAAVGLLLALHIAGGMVMFPFAGGIADRFDRRKVLIASNAFRAGLTFAVAGVVFAGTHPVAAVYFLAFTGGMGWTVFFPASRGLLQEILSGGEYTRGTGLVETSLQVGTFVSAAAMGLLYVHWGFGTILVIDACTFVASNALLMRMRHTSLLHPQHQPFLSQIGEGLRFLGRHRALLGYGIVLFVPFVATMSFNVVMPGYVSAHLKRNALTFGLADMTYGIGACAAGLAASAIAARLPRSRAISGLFLVSIGGLLFLAGNSWVVGLYAGCAAVGFSNSSLRVSMQAHLMELVPGAAMGRCMSIWLGISMCMHLLSSSAAGVLMDAFSPPAGFAWLAAVMMAGLCGACWVRRALERAGGRTGNSLHSAAPFTTTPPCSR